MGRRPEPESVDVDRPREPIRPDRGYKVGARISVGDAGRLRLASGVALAIVFTGMVFSVLGTALPVPELPVAPILRSSAATALPDIAILGQPAPAAFVPVTAGGLRWLDPTNGSMSGDAYTAPRGSLFVDDAGRGLCVCLEIPWSDERYVARVTLRRYSDAGLETRRVELYQLDAPLGRGFGEPIQLDAAIAPDGRHLWLVRTVRAEAEWDVGVDRVDLATLEVDASLELGPVRLPPPGASGVVRAPSGSTWITNERSSLHASLRVSPDGSKLSVLESLTSDPKLTSLLPSYQEERLVIPSDLAPDSVIEIVVPAHDASAETCDSTLTGWATERHFITICSRPEGEGVQPYVRVEELGESPRDVTVGPPVVESDSAWLLDARRGVVYRWSSQGHVFSRLEVATDELGTLALDQTRMGVGDMGPWPQPTGAGPAWSPLSGADLFLAPARMVGTADGTVIYAVGYRSVADTVRDDRVASTGIWVFDAERAQIVAHWAPAAMYDQIGFAPGRDRLVTLALPGTDGDGQPADWQTSIRFHDPRSGEVVEVLGDVQESSGFIPALMTPNAPGGIAGF